jgi:hypothetical protein
MNTPANATWLFPSGSENGAPLYLCQGNYAGGVQLGKYTSTLGCDFGYGGQEIALGSGYSVISLP